MNFIHCIVFSLLSISVTSCSEVNQKEPDSKNPIAPNFFETEHWVTGVIINKTVQGKDGSIWKFKSDDGKVYSLLVSIPDLGREHSKNKSLVQQNKHLRIKGIITKSGDGYRLNARQIEALE